MEERSNLSYCLTPINASTVIVLLLLYTNYN